MGRPDPNKPASLKPPAYVYVVLPACPDCRSTDLEGKATLPDPGDGTRSRYYHCRRCARRLIVVREPEINSESELGAHGLP